MSVASTPGVPPVPPPVPPWGAPPPPPSPARQSVLPWAVAAVAGVVALACAGGLIVTLAVDGDPAPASAADGAELPAGPRVERGFRTPEAAVTYVAERVSEGDLGGALEAFAVESLVADYSFEADVERVEVVSPVSWLPADSPGYRALDVELRRGEVAWQLRSLVRVVAAPELDFDMTIELDDETSASDIAAALAVDGLAGFAVVRADVLEPTMRPGADPDRNPFEAAAEAFGADELKEVAVLYETSEGLAVGGAEVLRYGDEWYVRSLSSALIGTSPGELTPTSLPAYEGLVASING